MSTRPQQIQAFFSKSTRERLRDGKSFIAVLEVCGFNDWLIRLLKDYRCHKMILIQPEEHKKRKTIAAGPLSDLLWVNRDPGRQADPWTPASGHRVANGSRESTPAHTP